jgi:hypothetical protein
LAARLHDPQPGTEPERAGSDHEAARFQKSAPIHFSIFSTAISARVGKLFSTKMHHGGRQ